MTNPLYKLATGGVIRLSDGAFIPQDPANRDYRSYQEWIDAGGMAAPEHSLDQLKAIAQANLENSCAASITEGFTSSALGTAYGYPSKATDQSNLQASVLASLFPGLAEDWTTPFWCQDAAGIWAYRPHTAAQIQRVGTDGKDAINARIARKIQLEEQLAKAKTLAEVEAITWTAPQ